MTLFDDEQILKAMQKDIENSTARETEKEQQEKQRKRMIKMGKLSLDEIALYVPSIPLDELKNLKPRLLRQVVKQLRISLTTKITA